MSDYQAYYSSPEDYRDSIALPVGKKWRCSHCDDLNWDEDLNSEGLCEHCAEEERKRIDLEEEEEEYRETYCSECGELWLVAHDEDGKPVKYCEDCERAAEEHIKKELQTRLDEFSKLSESTAPTDHILNYANHYLLNSLLFFPRLFKFHHRSSELNSNAAEFQDLLKSSISEMTNNLKYHSSLVIKNWINVTGGLLKNKVNNIYEQQ